MAYRRSGRSFKTILGHHCDADHTDHSTGFVDILNYSKILVCVHVGAITTALTDTNKVEFVIEHATVTSGPTQDVQRAPAELVLNGEGGAGVIKTVDSAHSKAASYIASYIGDRQYLRVFSNFIGSVTEDFPFAVAIIGFDRYLPSENDIDTG